MGLSIGTNLDDIEWPWNILTRHLIPYTAFSGARCVEVNEHQRQKDNHKFYRCTDRIRRVSDLYSRFQGHVLQNQISTPTKGYNGRLIGNRVMIYRMVSCSMSLNDTYPKFQWHAIIRRWISQKWCKIPHGYHSWMWPIELCDCRWSWVTFKDHFSTINGVIVCTCIHKNYSVDQIAERYAPSTYWAF